MSEEDRECPSGLGRAKEECAPCNDPRLGLLVRCPGCLFLALLLFGGKVCCSDMAIEPGALTAPLGIAAPTNFGAVVLDKLLVNEPSSGATA